MFDKLILGLFVSFALNGISQVEELKRVQDVRKQYIDPSAASTEEGQKRAQIRGNSQYINPFIGTGGHGHTYPGAAVPFGMIQLSPDTRHDGWDGCSGYHYSDSVIYGFSHTHLSGTGVPDLCDILIVPQQGEALTDPGYLNPKGYGSKFSHSDEQASPGFYSVKLLKNNINVSLYAAERSGMHVYTFNEAKGKKFILIDLDHRDELLSSEIKVKGNTLSGHRHSRGWAVNQKLFFSMELNVPFQSKLISDKGKHKMLLEFPETTQTVMLKIGISAVDEAGAANNLNQEIPAWTPAILHYEADRKWNQELNKIRFQSPDKEVMVNFYTALYHTFICPTTFTDVDGRYLGNDGKIHQSGDHPQYSIFSLWDTYRAAHPLYTLTQEKRTRDFIESFLRIYQQTGDLPVWELVGNETDCMIGYHSVSVILDACRKGMKTPDLELALNAMIATSNLNEYGKKQYVKNGFLGTDVEPESVSKTLEYAYDDWCIAELAREMGKDSIYQVYLKRSYNFLNVFDPQTKFMRARRGGQWFSPFNPSEVNFNYTEANSWQYSLAAPQHIDALREAMGGKDSLQMWLDRLFTTGSTLAGREQADITGLIGQYAHGNEPSHHMAYLYNYTNEPHKTQEKVDQILKEMYHNAPDGLSGNEDCGQMSAWYVLSAMGIYPVCPGKPVYAIGRPLQTYARMQFENGKSFAIRTQNNSAENKYVQSMLLNGQPYEKLFISHADILAGGELTIVMGNMPNSKLKDYASEVSREEAPESFLPVPFFTATQRTFDQSITTEIKAISPRITGANYDIRFTTDGTEPTASSEIYSAPLTFRKHTVLKAAVFAKATKNHSASVSTTFAPMDQNKSLELVTTYANQYAAGGKNALIDGIRSESTDYRSGDWQGYQGNDVQGIIRFENAKLVSSISIRCLQDEHSWIFLPEEFAVEYSVDGVNFVKLPANKNKISPLEKGAFASDLKVVLPKPTEVKAIRFKAKNRGVCPPGHISAGGKSWVFADEIAVE